MDLKQLQARAASKAGDSLPSTHAAELPIAPEQSSKRKWTDADYIRRGVDRTPRVSVTARIKPENRAKLERLATVARVTLSDFVDTLIQDCEDFDA